MRLPISLLLLIPSVSIASLPTDVNRICYAVKLFGRAEACEADYNHHQLNVSGIEATKDFCDKFTYMVSINTSEFKDKEWKLKISDNDNQISCHMR